MIVTLLDTALSLLDTIKTVQGHTLYYPHTPAAAGGGLIIPAPIPGFGLAGPLEGKLPAPVVGCATETRIGAPSLSFLHSIFSTRTSPSISW